MEDLKLKGSCENFIGDTSTSSASGVNFTPKDHAKKKEAEPSQPSCSQTLSTSSSESTSMTTGMFNSECRLHKTDREGPPNIGYEVNVAKSIMKQYSSRSGDNLFDHLSDIIKRVIDERPPNVIDFFEEFSRNIREQKFHLPERFQPDAIYEETRLYPVAKKILESLNLPYYKVFQEIGGSAEEMSMEEKSNIASPFSLDLFTERLFITFHERVQQLQFYWNQCGFSICSDDIFQLACSMDRLQTHTSILQCRFWGLINGLKAPYYIVEASLTREEIRARLAQMEAEIMHKSPHIQGTTKAETPSHVSPELIPGVNGWENHPVEELNLMRPIAAPIPIIPKAETYDVPPEPIGMGLNRFSYFVVNELSGDWIELPIVTPKQIVISRLIKKFLTGDLEAEVNSYPAFPGKEKHYLRTVITRITAGTYVAPNGFYRKMTKRELRLYNGLEEDEMEEEEDEIPEEGEEEETEIMNNDVLLLRNEKFDQQPWDMLTGLDNWLHVRPNILMQGRIVWYDMEKARKQRQKEMERLMKQRLAEEMGEEEEEEEGEEEEDYEGEGEGEAEEEANAEIGPPILSPISFDNTIEQTIPWTIRQSSKYTNENERVLILRSNIWPGAFSFIFGKTCDSIYIGWGHKYTSRNIPFHHLPQPVDEFPHEVMDFIEATDPTVAEEEEYRLWLLKKELQYDEGEGEQNLTDYEYGKGIESGSEGDDN